MTEDKTQWLKGYTAALVWAVSLNESCGDWLNDAIEEELGSVEDEARMLRDE